MKIICSFCFVWILVHPVVADMDWETTDASVALIKKGQTVWRFEYGADQTKPYFHPVALPGGPSMTVTAPKDHPWHYGLWFSWKYINGVNYWEENRTTGKSDGRTRWENVRIETKPDYSASITMDLVYEPADGEQVLTERREIHVSCPAEDGSYRFDWMSRFTAVQKVMLDRTPLPHEKGGKPWGGYAGLSIRMALGMSDRQVAGIEGPVDMTSGRNRLKSPALDYSGVVDGTTMGFAVFDHPENLNAPTPWYAIATREMSYFSPAVICYGPHTLEAGESFTLRYHMILHPGRWDAEALRERAL